MKILHVIATGERRGAEMFASDLIRALDRADVDQRVAVLRGTPPLPAAYAAPTTTLTRGPIQVPGLRMNANSVASLIAIARDWRPTVVQAHGGEPYKYSILAARRSGSRVVYRRIGLVPPRATQGMPNRIHGSLMRRSDRIVAVAEAVRRETISRFRVPADRVVTIPRGVDSSRLRPQLDRQVIRETLGIAPDAMVVLSLGALTWEKDPGAHFQVMSLVRRSIPGAVHLIAGDGPFRARVEGAAQHAGLNGLAKVLGNRADVADLLHASDVMLLASRSEGMPGCLIEAGLTGVPAAAYGVAGVTEVIRDGETGYIVNRGDRHALADRVVDLLSRPRLRASMGTASRRHCADRFDIQVISPRYLDLYDEIGS